MPPDGTAGDETREDAMHDAATEEQGDGGGASGAPLPGAPLGADGVHAGVAARDVPPASGTWEDGWSDGAGVRLHHVSAGRGPLVLLLHGFPDFWYGWRRQLPALAAAGFRAVAPDLRGYNLSERPARVADYRIERLADDVAALVRALGADRAHVVGHDWGGLIAWQLAMRHPQVVDRLAILNAPHPARFRRLLLDPRQGLRSWYVAFFQLPWLPERVLGANGRRALRRTRVALVAALA